MTSARNEARLGGKRWNRIVDDTVKWYRDTEKKLEGWLLEDGYPAFHQPVSPYMAYQALIALRNAGDPRFWTNPAAQQRLLQLSQRFGPPPLAGPLGQPPPYPGGQVAYTPRMGGRVG